MSVMCLYRAVVAKSNGQKEQMIPLLPYETPGSLSPMGLPVILERGSHGCFTCSAADVRIGTEVMYLTATVVVLG